MNTEPDPRLVLEVDGQTLVFQAFSSFIHFVQAKSRISKPLASRLRGYSEQQLESQALALRRTINELTAVIGRSYEEHGSLGRYLDAQAASLFTRDQGWRELIVALTRAATDLEGEKRAAMLQYVHYLSARYRETRAVHREKLQGKRLSALVGADVPAHRGGRPAPGALAAHRNPAETIGEGAGIGRLGFTRLSPSQPIGVRPDRDGRVEVVLAGHHFQVSLRPVPALRDDRGYHYSLRKGANLVGRDPSCDVVLGPGFPTVSRRHLKIEVAQCLVWLTDMSSQGTSVRTQQIEAPLGCVGL